MSRINTNVSSLISQNTLGRSNRDLQTALGRLSTGLRINSGADDPAGLIASENLRRDITAANQAISNSQQAGQLISTADSALGEVSRLLNDIRGLVTEAANSGALSDEQIGANQLQVDSSLEAIDRISQVTTFQGRKVLDGTLDFNVTEGSNFSKLSNLQIGQANLGTTGQIAAQVDVKTAATQAQVDITNVPATTSAVNAFGDGTLSHAIAQSTQSYAITNGTFSVTASAGQTYDGAAGNAINVQIIDNAAGTATINGNVLEVRVDVTGGANISDVVNAINANADFSSSLVGPDGVVAAGDVQAYGNLVGGRDAGSATIRVTADTAGATANGVTTTITESTTIANNSASASIDTNGDIQVLVRGTVTYSAIAAAVDGLTGYSASVTTSTGDQNYIDTVDTPPVGAFSTLGSGQDAAGGLSQDVVFELAGQNGREVFSFDQGTSITQLQSAINALSDSTGVQATVNSTTLELTSTEYGSNSSVEISVVSEAAGGTITAAVGSQSRDTGSDISATINGIQANGDGNSLSINTSTLDLGLEVTAGYTGSANFTITGGGALFQLGPQVVTNQQARLGIGSVSTARLGGSTGRLYELRSGQSAALSTDTTRAANIVDEVITNVVELRGRLGAFTRTTLQSNITSLQDTVVNLTDAESAIRDADFAKESASLTRAQILVQSGTSVLAIANQNPQNVLALLR